MSCHAELNCSRELLRNKNEREFRWNVEQHFRWRRIATSAHPHIDRKINKIGQLKERFNESTIIHKTDQQIDINTNQANYNLVFWHFFLYFWCSFTKKLYREMRMFCCAGDIISILLGWREVESRMWYLYVCDSFYCWLATSESFNLNQTHGKKFHWQIMSAVLLRLIQSSIRQQ